MRYTIQEAKIRKIDNNLTITDLFTGNNFNFDFVIAELDGNHPTLINNVSDRAYFILEGNGIVKVNGKEYTVKSFDLVAIKAKTPHTIKGKLKYAIITSPPFNPDNERIMGE